MATEDAVYRQSTQFRLWSFSPAQLASLRSQTNELARESIIERRRQQKDQGEGSSTSSSSASVSPLPLPEFLTPAEERLLLDFFTVELLRAGQFTEQPTEVQATAAVFLRRFYVTHSLLTYPPAALFKTALFFGAKAEGYYHKLDHFASKFPNTTAADILAGEFLLCQGIRFAFEVKHPFRALEGAVMQLRMMVPTGEEAGIRAADDDGEDDDGLSDNRISAAHRRAREILKFSPLVTDAYFHYTPSQIMLAALALADRGLVERLLLHDVFKKPAAASAAASTTTAARRKEAEWERINGAAVRDRVMAAIDACAALLATEPPERFSQYWGQPESNNLIKPLLKKLRACRDPDRSNLVALQQAKKEGAVKSYATGASADDAAVFGSSIGGLPPKTGGAAAAAAAAGPAASAASDNSLHEAKRRKVQLMDDPFGPALN